MRAEDLLHGGGRHPPTPVFPRNEEFGHVPLDPSSPVVKPEVGFTITSAESRAAVKNRLSPSNFSSIGITRSASASMPSAETMT